MKIIKQFQQKIKQTMVMATRTSLQTVSRSILPANIVSKIGHVVIDNDTFVRCCVVGIPQNPDVGGYPEKMNPFLIAELLAIEGEDFRLQISYGINTVSYTHLRAHETRHDLVCRLLLEKKKNK